MPPTGQERERARLARALAEFWAGGAGPTHGELNDLFDTYGIHPELGSKRDRVSEAVKSVGRQELVALVTDLVDLLRESRQFDARNEWGADEATIRRLAETLVPYGATLLGDGRLRTGHGLTVESATLPDLPAVRDHIQRIRLALAEGDSALLLGSSKELLESTAKIVLERVHEEPPAKFPGLIARALEILMLHPRSEPTQREDLLEPVRKILGGILQIATEVNELRNERGTGHGRLQAPVTLSERHSRLAAGAAVLVATLMLDTLDDPAAPWQRDSAA